MFGIGLTEILVILILIFVLINPKDLPKIAKKLGDLYRRFLDVRDRINKEVKDVEKEIRKPFEESANGIKKDIQETIDSVKFSHPLPDIKTIKPSRNITSLVKEEPSKDPEKNMNNET